MRRKHLILASCIISALLLTFTFHVSADENVEVDAGASSDSAPLLDSYFWDNYILLPYIDNNLGQYMNTGVYLNSNSTVHVQFTPYQYSPYNSIFGAYSGQTNRFQAYYQMSGENQNITLGYDRQNYTYNVVLDNYSVYDCYFSDEFYFNHDLEYTFEDTSPFTSPYTCYIFARNNNNSSENRSHMRLYLFSIYDSSLNDPNEPDSGEVGYVRYYYPAKSKSGGVIGLYDAVTKTFLTSATSDPFTLPDGSNASMGISANINQFLLNGISWIGDIFEFAIQEPMILMFMAIGLCGVAFRWARRVVHF